MQIIVYFVVFADIPVARIVVCFLYLMLVPGIVILKLLALKNLDVAEKALFSVGLSVAFLMFMGVILNEIAKLAFTSPLSLNLLLFSINTTILLMSFIGARHDDSTLALAPQTKYSKLLFLILLSISLLLLGSYGIIVVNTSGNSLFLLLLIFAISIVISLVFLSEKIIPSNLYPLILFVICICMLLFVSSTSLITKYITGSGDQWIEYYAFRLTEINHFWNSALAPSPQTSSLFPTYSTISVTILPLVFSTITGLDGSSIFKLLYPLIVGFLALGSYKLYQTQTDNKAAFLATFFLITISVGKGLGSSKQMVASLFYVSLFLLLLRKEFSASKRSILVIIFATGLVISHYALGYIFLFTVLFAFLIFALMNYGKTGKFSSHRTISLTLVLVLLAIAFSWYIFVNSSATFNLLRDEVNTVTSNLGQFFNPESRGTALQGLGLVQTTSIFNSISSAFFILTEFLLVIGFIKLIASKDKTSRFSIEYKVIAALNMAIIAMNLLLPVIADTFLMSRFYQTTLIILAPLAVLGGKTIVELLPKPSFRKLYASLLVFMVFIPLFLFQTGFVYEVTRVQSSSLPLSMHRWSGVELYGYVVDAQEVAGAQWIPKYANVTNIVLYSDGVSIYNVLTGYGMIGRGRAFYLLNTTRPTSNELIYLANRDLISKGYIFNASEISPIVENQDKIYANGECEIYKGYSP